MTTGKVIWDAGHGGRDPGALSPSGLQEKDLVLDIVRRIARLEPGFGGRVTFQFTRLTDTDMSPEGQSYSEVADLTARTDLANAVPKAADREDRLFVSIHLNADASQNGKGVSVWSYPGSQGGGRLAQVLLNWLQPELAPWIGLYGSGLFTANFHVLRETVMPAALIEAGFIGTQAEADQLNRPVVRQHIAEAAVLAVADMFGERYMFLSDNDLDYEHFDWNTPSHATADELERAFAGTAMAGLGQAFVQAEQEHGVHAIAFAAHAAWESAWGTSQIAHDKNNLFGYGASDDDPYGGAHQFATREEGILYVAERVKRDYLTPGGQFYHGSNLTGMNVMYATDQNWRHGIAGLWERIRPFQDRFGVVTAPEAEVPAQQPEPTPTPAPSLPPLVSLDPAAVQALLSKVEELLALVYEVLGGRQA